MKLKLDRPSLDISEDIKSTSFQSFEFCSIERWYIVLKFFYSTSIRKLNIELHFNVWGIDNFEKLWNGKSVIITSNRINMETFKYSERVDSILDEIKRLN